MEALDNRQKLSEIVTAVANLQRSLGENFILVGGASLVCQGSERVTSDVDLLLPGASIPRLAYTLTQSSVTRRAGVIYSIVEESEFPVDILEKVIGEKTYEDLEPFTITIFDEIKTLDFPIALGIKIRCWFLRDEETPLGIQKQESDLVDIGFICERMEQAGKVVDDMVAKAIPISCYNMQLVKDCLKDTGSLALFLSVGGHKFQVPWEEDSEEQRGYYMEMMADEAEAACQQGVTEEGFVRPRVR
ncbi:hypothetical protein B9Z19DRAFT_1191536 [Tuber borchii]|uniref:Nucleotidyl transferase domain-containing protein n=1 Tax=Tuber borchii TaxID=42251 RepID=A0A2T6ZZK4_TUBBO|nr:hypothetical protein B9Z19DRAFT_1191536 [Tuber borchii]